MHQHEHPPASYGRAFTVGIILNSAFIIVEFIYGLSANSLSLVADAGHNLGDVLGLFLAWGGFALAKVRPTPNRTYGWRGTTILAALLNAMLLLVAIGGIISEAVHRLQSPDPSAGITVMVVAAVGVLVNGFTAFLFLKGRKGDLNIQAAFLHMASDAAVSVGVIISGFFIWKTGLAWVDPVTSIVLSIVIFVGTWGLLKESVNLALQAVPKNIDATKVRLYLENLPGIEVVHDLHIWAMSTSEIALTAHLVKSKLEADDDLIAEAAEELRHNFGIGHVTLQIERKSSGCDLAPDDVV